MKIRDKTAIYHKLVYEVRYDFGLVYLDRCGTTANRIVESNPDWVVQEDAISPQGAPLVHATTGTQLNFNTQKYSFSLDQPVGRESALTRADIDLFISHAEAVGGIVHRELDLKFFIREGFRVWYLFGTDSEEESQQWMRSLNAFSVSDIVTAAFVGKLESENHVALIASHDRKFRVSMTGVERQEILDLGTEALKTLPRRLPRRQREHLLEQLRAKRRMLSNPEFAVMVDVDVFVDNPVEVAPTDFMNRSLTLVEEALPKAFGGKSQ